MSEDEINRWIRLLAASWVALTAINIPFNGPRESAYLDLALSRDGLHSGKLPGLDTGNPGSITSTPSSASFPASAIFCSGAGLLPGLFPVPQRCIEYLDGSHGFTHFAYSSLVLV